MVTLNLKSKRFIKIAQFSQLLQKMFSGALLPLDWKLFTRPELIQTG